MYAADLDDVLTHYIELSENNVMRRVMSDAATKLRQERDDAVQALLLHEVGSAYAHRLAVMLECALLNADSAWNDAHALLDEYRAACRAAAPMQEPPTFMGEPVVTPNVE